MATLSRNEKDLYINVSFSPGQLLYLFYLLTFNNVESFSKREMSDICSRSKCKCFASVSYLHSLFYLTFFVVEYFYFFLLANENTLISAKRGLLLLPGLAFLFIFKPIVLARFFFRFFYVYVQSYVPF